MKGLAVDENNMSTEISASSTASLYPQHSSTSTKQQPLPRKKRSLPGHPDPEADVIALSPKALLATNRFICEVCNKGFQREQNLQLHRRGHNLPWKLKQTNNKETRKKVYVCPEPTCVHHHPSRALGDLTGIKKHFFRKHGEKKWNCEKCSKRYAVQSDCKAHSKICGTREYKCDCGTLFSRRDSFITHRAFCDALAQETGRAITAMNPLVSSQTPLHSHGLQAPSVKNEIEFNQVIRPEIPQYWWACPPEGEACRVLRTSDFSSPLLPTHLDQPLIHQENPNPTTLLPSFHSFHSASPHTSAAALLHKASSIGVTLGKTALRPHQPPHVPEFTTGHGSSSMASSAALVSGFHMPSREEIGTGFDLASYGNKAGITSDYLEQSLAEAPSLFHDMTGTVSSANGFERPSFEEALRGMFNNATRDSNFQELVSKSTEFQFSKSTKGTANDEMTRDFLGLKAFSPRNIFNMSGLDHWGSSSDGKQNQNQAPWQ